METEALRAIHREAAAAAGGRTWPNELGFAVGGWSYRYSEVDDGLPRWQAVRFMMLGPKFGRGATPAEARAAAVLQYDP